MPVRSGSCRTDSSRGELRPVRNQVVIRLLYNLLWPLGLLFFLPGYLVKMFRRGGYREKFGQRLGIYDADVRQRLSQQTSMWLHAVSVGEVAVALKLVFMSAATAGVPATNVFGTLKVCGHASGEAKNSGPRHKKRIAIRRTSLIGASIGSPKLQA